MKLLRRLLPLCAAVLWAGSASAASITYFLSQTNDPEGWLPDGTQDYVSITFADSTTVAGDIDVTVQALSPLTDIANVDFGIDSFMFNSINVLGAANLISVPSNWNVSFDYNPGPPHQVGNGFGRFEIGLTTTGDANRLNPLTFTIRIAGDSLADYAVLATNGSQGDSYFAVRVSGFFDQDPDAPLDPIDIGNPGIGECWDADGRGNYSPGCNILTSAWFGGTSTASVPEPSAVLLLASALTALALRRPN